MGETEKGEDNVGPDSRPDVWIRGNGAGLSETALGGSSEETGDSTAESSILIVGARCLCRGRGESGSGPSEVEEDMADIVLLLFSRSAKRQYSKEPDSRKLHEDSNVEKSVRQKEKMAGLSLLVLRGTNWL